MLSRSSQAAADLLSCQSLPICRKCMLSPTLRRRDVFLRFNSQQSEPDPEDTLSLPFLHDRPTHRRKNGRSRRQLGEKVPISVTALGEPAEVLLVKERQRLQFRGQVQDEPADQNSLSLMLEEAEASKALVDEDSVIGNIESLRRYKPGGRLSPDEWRDYRREIWKSFTNKQLCFYISKFSSKEGKEEQEEGGAPGHGKGVSSRWRPGISKFLDSADVGDAVRVARSQENLKVKDILGEKILRDCWKLGVMGETGQLDYQLSPPLLSLLVQSSNFSFEVLASLHGAQVDLTHSIGLIRLTGSQKACETLRDVVHDATSRIREEDIQLYSQDDPREKASNRIYTPEFLSWICKTHGVAFEQHRSKPSKLFYLAENKQGAEDARRTLNLAVYDLTTPKASFGTYVPASEPIAYHSSSPENNTSWWNRGKSWFRWAVPPAQSAEANVLDTPFFDNHETRLSDELLKLLRKKSNPQIDRYDGTKVAETISAAFGRCLFLRKPSLSDETINASQLGKLSVPRTFTTDFPQVTSFLRLLTRTLSRHRVQLVPSLKYANVLPPIDVEFMAFHRPDEGNPTAVVLMSAKMILAKSTVDYLLPENGLDLRFTRQLTREILSGSSLGTGASSDSPLRGLEKTLQDLFAQARANHDNRPLPAFINLSLPNHVLPNDSAHTDPKGETAGEYMFLPVGNYSATRMYGYDYLGYDLKYSYFESGPYLAHRTTDCFLSVDLPRRSTEEPGEVRGAWEFQSFYKAACAFAFDVDKAWRAKSAGTGSRYIG